MGNCHDFAGFLDSISLSAMLARGRFVPEAGVLEVDALAAAMRGLRFSTK